MIQGKPLFQRLASSASLTMDHAENSEQNSDDQATTATAVALSDDDDRSSDAEKAETLDGSAASVKSVAENANSDPFSYPAPAPLKTARGGFDDVDVPLASPVPVPVSLSAINRRGYFDNTDTHGESFPDLNSAPYPYPASYTLFPEEPEESAEVGPARWPETAQEKVEDDEDEFVARRRDTYTSSWSPDTSLPGLDDLETPSEDGSVVSISDAASLKLLAKLIRDGNANTRRLRQEIDRLSNDLASLRSDLEGLREDVRSVLDAAADAVDADAADFEPMHYTHGVRLRDQGLGRGCDLDSDYDCYDRHDLHDGHERHDRHDRRRRCCHSYDNPPPAMFRVLAQQMPAPSAAKRRHGDCCSSYDSHGPADAKSWWHRPLPVRRFPRMR